MELAASTLCACGNGLATCGKSGCTCLAGYTRTYLTRACVLSM